MSAFFCHFLFNKPIQWN